MLTPPTPADDGTWEVGGRALRRATIRMVVLAALTAVNVVATIVLFTRVASQPGSNDIAAIYGLIDIWLPAMFTGLAWDDRPEKKKRLAAAAAMAPSVVVPADRSLC